MNKIYTADDELLVSKDIVDVPYSNEVDYATFSNVLKDDKVVASYKMYWLLSILDEVVLGERRITFRTLICKMICKAWYPISKFKLSFGYCDNLGKVVEYISTTFPETLSLKESELFKFLYESEDKTLNKMIIDLTYNVPYRFLSPFFRKETHGKKSGVEKIIQELSTTDKRCVYSIWGEAKKDKYIIVKEEWCRYLKYNFKILQGWTYYKLVCFLQKRNPNVPAIAMKLEAPVKRNLSSATKIWKAVIEKSQVKDIYTGLEFNEENFKEHGVLSIDHFIPWSFVLHDQMWNLVPTFKNVNSSKSDKLVPYGAYIDKFAKVQFNGFCYVVENKKVNEIEEYREALKVYKVEELVEREGEFVKRLEEVVEPVYNIAVNQGF